MTVGAGILIVARLEKSSTVRFVLEQGMADNVSCGELIREGYDQTQTIDPAHLQFVFRGMLDRHKQAQGHGEFQWRIGVLKPVIP